MKKQLVHVTSNPVSPLLAELRESVEPMSLDTILRFAVEEGNLRRSIGWHEDLDQLRDYLGDFLRDAGVNYPCPARVDEHD